MFQLTDIKNDMCFKFRYKGYDYELRQNKDGSHVGMASNMAANYVIAISLLIE